MGKKRKEKKKEAKAIEQHGFSDKHKSTLKEEIHYRKFTKWKNAYVMNWVSAFKRTTEARIDSTR